MKYLLPLFFFVLLNSTICIISGKKFGRCLPMTFMVSTFVLYISQCIFNTFNVGLTLLLFLALASFFCVFFIRGWKFNKSILLTSGLISFFAIYFVYFIIDFNRSFVLWDELMHWGKMVKEMFRLDQFYAVSESTLIRHKDYPPFISLFEFLWCKLSGGYSEDIVSMAIHIFSISLIIPYIFEKKIDINKVSVFNIFLCNMLYVLLYIILIAFLDGYGTFYSIYTDIFISIMFAYSMILVYSNDAINTKFGFVCYILSLMSLISIKQIGVYFVFISIFYFIICGIIKIRYNNKKIYNIFIKILVSIIIPFIVYKYWNLFISNIGIVGQFDTRSKVNFISYVNIILYGSGIQHDTFIRFIRALFEKNITTSIFPISYVSSILIVILLCIMCRFLARVKLSKEDTAVLIFVLAVGALGYAALLSILYVFCFEQNEMIYLRSYSRYMSSYFIGEIIFILFIIISKFKYITFKLLNIKYATLLSLVCAVILTPSNMIGYIPQCIRGDTMLEFHRLANILIKRTNPNKSVYIVYKSDSVDDYQVYISYYCDDIYIDTAYFDVLNENFNKDKNVYTQAVNEMNKNDYVFVVHVSDSFNKYFLKYLTDEKQKFTAETVYKVSHDANGLLQLAPLE